MSDNQTSITKKSVRKVLNNKIHQLNDIIADIDQLLTQMETDFYRVSIFGSARLSPDSVFYSQVFDLASKLAFQGADIVTGGGPGLMEAANKGAREGSKKSRSFGLHVDLPFEADTNNHLDVMRHHRRFSSRLDEFMRISHAVVITPGGIGTLLEWFYAWQLIQVKHITPRPILLMGGGEMWPEMMKWLETWPMGMQLMSKQDIENIELCETPDDVIKRLEPDIKKFYEKSDRATLKKELK